MTIKEKAAKMKLDSPQLAPTSIEERNQALLAISEKLLAHKAEIMEANKQDLENAEKEQQIAPAVVKRLKFGEEKLQSVIEGIKELVSLPDPLFQI